MEHPYFAKPGQSSGKLSRFWNGGDYSPDIALRQIDWKYDFEKGHAFEAVVMDTATGSGEFGKKYYVSEIDNEPPDEIAEAIKDGRPLAGLEILTQKGERNKTYSKRHAYIDEAIGFPGLIPVCQKDYGAMRTLAKSIMGLEFPEWHPLKGHKIGEYLAVCEWQTEHYWTDGGMIQKKALADCLYIDQGMAFPVDLKWTGAFSQFRSAMRSHHWIQALHYEMGIRATRGVKCAPMLFVVGCAAEPPLAQTWGVDQRNVSDLLVEYDRLCMAWHTWELAGSPKTGTLPAKEVKIWI